jgi:hypothetical protein
MFFFVGVPLLLAIPILICAAIAADNRAKKLARIVRENSLNEARLIKQVEHLPNSGVSALDIARADQLLERDADSGRLSWRQTFGVLGACLVITLVIAGAIKHQTDTGAAATPTPTPIETGYSVANVSSTPEAAASETQESPTATATPEIRRGELVKPVAKHHYKHGRGD